ncbi:MAG: MgtC/SapB family protein [Gammaproteobacteria bacterium]
MDIITQLHICAELFLAFILGGLIGFERERAGIPAGVRTFSAVAVGACLFSIVSSHALGHYDSTRIAAQVASGMGFLGAGVIFKHGDLIRGLTTAGVLWASSAVGISVGFQLYIVAVFTTFLLVFMLHVSKYKAWRRMMKKSYRTTSTKNEF